LSGIIALVAVLISGGWGPGALWMQCETADGTVRVESYFSRCCERDHDPDALGHDADHHHPAASLAPADHCTDTPLVVDAERQQAARRSDVAPTDICVTFSPATFFNTTLVPTCVCTSPPARPPAAAAALDTVVLRC
jgi:hypothetical protein